MKLTLIAVLLASTAQAKPPTLQTLLVVEAAQQAQAEAAMIQICGPKAKGTFSVERVGVGNKKYYIASGSWLTTEQLTAFTTAMGPHVPAKRVQIFQGVHGRTKLKELKIEKVKK